MSNVRHGPGPIVHGQSLNDTSRYVVELPGFSAPTLMTREEIAAIPLQHQWFSGTQTGLIASWWSREVAERHGQELGVIVGQIMPVKQSTLRLDDDRHDKVLLILVDERGIPLQGEPLRSTP